MKRCLVTLVATLSMLLAWAVDTVSNERHSLHAGIEGAFSFNHTDIEEPNGLYRQVSAYVSYTYHIKDFYLNPELSLYYQYNPNMFPGIVGVTINDSHCDAFGSALGLYIGRKIAGPVSIFTGPLGKCNFYQGGSITSTSGNNLSGDWTAHRAALLWRFGVSFDVWRLRIRAAYDQHITKQYYLGTLNDFSVSVAFKF